jgi:anion-transporting  ArsA/GET3 family ATPase
VQALLGSPETAFVLVASPRADTVGEATHFAERLEAQGLAVRALVVNRMHPTFGGMAAAEARDCVAPAGGPDRPLGALWANLADFRAVAEREEETLAALAARVAPAPVVRVPLLDDDVHDLDGLATVGSHLLPGAA